LNIYLDTSFLVSFYSTDANSAAAVQVMHTAAGAQFLTTFAELEVVNALGRRVFRKEVAPAQAQSSLNDFEQDLRAGIFQLKPLPDSVFGRARHLSRQTTPRLGTRTVDVLHVAAALEPGSDWFQSFARQQRKLVQAVKLKVNPLP
jgi:predicted nucleic acid-binding protein